MPGTTKSEYLYLRPKKRPNPKQWYVEAPLGINSIRATYNRLCKIAGFTKGNFTNQSGRVSSCARMFGKNKDEQLIVFVSGHCSTVIHNYKLISYELHKDLSDAIQGNSVKNDDQVICETVSKLTTIKSNVNQIWRLMCLKVKQKTLGLH